MFYLPGHAEKCKKRLWRTWQWRTNCFRLSQTRRRSKSAWLHLVPTLLWSHVATRASARTTPTRLRLHKEQVVPTCRANVSLAMRSFIYLRRRQSLGQGLQWRLCVCWSVFGLLQRCVVKRSSLQYSEAAVCPEHCGEDRHTVAKKGTCSTTAGTVILASCPSTDREQAGRTDIQDPSFINPRVPCPSHQIASNFTSSSFLRHAFNAQTHYQNSLCWLCFLLYCCYSLEFP